MTYATLYDIAAGSDEPHPPLSAHDMADDWRGFDRTDSELSGDDDDDISDWFGGTVQIYHGGN